MNSPRISPPPTPGAPLLTTIPLPDEDDIHVPIPQLDPLLSTTSESLQDFSLPLDMGITAADHPLQQIAANFPATMPPLLQVTVIFASPPHWKIPIFAHETDFITISDLIERIHRFLHVLILPPHQNIQATERYLYRCSLIADQETRQGELHEGPKRVDLLEGVHRFAGMVWLSRNVLLLHLQP